MNRCQRLINKIAKDDMKKKIYKSLGTNFRRHRKIVRFGMRGMTLQELIDYKNFNKRLKI